MRLRSGDKHYKFRTGPFVGRHFLFVRHFAGEMISSMWPRACIYGSETYVLPGNVHVCV